MSTELEIKDVSTLESNLAKFLAEAARTEITSAEDYEARVKFLVRVRAIKKQVGFLLDPGITKAQALVNELRLDKAKWTRKVDEIDAIVSAPVQIWIRKEREAAEDEQKRLDEVARTQQAKEIKNAVKSGDIGKREGQQQLIELSEKENPSGATVQSARPKVAGARARVNWKFRIVKAQKIPIKYLTPDGMAIGKMVRETEDKKKAEAECPGIEVWCEDKI